ncbi:MAG: hypothetical protein AABZ06_02585 [Bdellovibrionota bacterium]
MRKLFIIITFCLVAIIPSLENKGSAAVSAFDLGVRWSNLTGTPSIFYSPDTGWEGRVLIRQGEPANRVFLTLTSSYRPLQLKNMSNDVHMNILSFLAGIYTNVEKKFWFFTPALGVQAGPAYGWLAFPATSNTTLNSKLYFTMQAEPGLEFPIYGQLSGNISMPVQIIFSTPALTVWGELLSLRWNL